ncbi:MAG: hypothetical protein AB7E78_08810 [Porticoccaceae bacterium]
MYRCRSVLQRVAQRIKQTREPGLDQYEFRFGEPSAPGKRQLSQILSVAAQPVTAGIGRFFTEGALQIAFRVPIAQSVMRDIFADLRPEQGYQPVQFERGLQGLRKHPFTLGRSRGGRGTVSL